MVWRMFTNDNYRRLFIDWDNHAKGMIARFRTTSAPYIEDPWLFEFIKALENESEEFKLWWSLHDVQNNDEVHKILRHPIVDILTFEFSSFDLTDNSRLQLIVNTPCANTDTAIKMRTLLKL